MREEKRERERKREEGREKKERVKKMDKGERERSCGSSNCKKTLIVSQFWLSNRRLVLFPFRVI